VPEAFELEQVVLARSQYNCDKALGLTVPATLLAQSDDVIEYRDEFRLLAPTGPPAMSALRSLKGESGLCADMAESTLLTKADVHRRSQRRFGRALATKAKS
jgi:hypothetical protein